MTFRKYLVLFAVAVFAACGDVCLARGMKDFGAVTSANWNHLLASLWNPWVVTGICLLLLFLSSYLTALSWADLTYVLPATAISYVLMALLGKFFLHENVTRLALAGNRADHGGRWLRSRWTSANAGSTSTLHRAFSRPRTARGDSFPWQPAPGGMR